MNGAIGLRLEQYSAGGDVNGGESSCLAASGRGRRLGRILIMDDSRVVRETMHRQLAVLGYEVVASVDGKEAHEVFRQAHGSGRPFDAVILDLMVPDGWGGERTLSELRKLDPGVKALVCSGSLTNPAAHYRRLGFCGVLSKPYALGELRQVVAAALSPARDL